MNKNPTSDTSIRTTDRKWQSERAQKGAKGFGSPSFIETVERSPKGAFFLNKKKKKRIIPLSPRHFCSSLWLGSRGGDQEWKTDGQSRGWTSRSSKQAADALFFWKLCQQPSIYWPLLFGIRAHERWTFWQVCVLCRICKNEPQNFSALCF